MLRLIKYLVTLTLLLVVFLPVVVLMLGLQQEPLVPVDRKLTAGDIARAKALIERYDPRGQSAGELRTLEVPEADLSLLLGYGVGRLVLCHPAIDGYRRLSLIRASSVENRQFTSTASAFRRSCHAVTSSRRVCWFGMRRFRHWRCKIPNSISAMFNQLPCLGV